jgi:prefoldin subunit 1
VNQITIGELNEIPLEEERKMYRGVGKMFMMENKDQIFEHLKDEIKDNEKKISDYEQKKEYLERRITSQRQNIMECAGVR